VSHPDDASGPLVARLFHRLLAIVFITAWLSLGVQALLLLGSDGLVPAADLLTHIEPDPLRLPTWLWLNSSDTAIVAGIWLGGALSLSAALGWRPRACTGAATLLYLGYVLVGREFLSFQWDNLLLECGFLAVFLPTDRRARWIHVLFRLLLLKLYWESGIAKWQSHLGDWQDGSAMVFYYETAPLPTWLAWYAHHLPVWWHHFESRAVLAFELALPLSIFGPRRARLSGAAILTAFQLINIATANYGFFCYLSLALHVFLLGDRDLPRLFGAVPRARDEATRVRRAARLTAAIAVTAAFVSISLVDGARTFAALPGWMAQPPAWFETLRSWRLVNTYHLFGHITRQRIEAEFQTENGGVWTARDLRYKAGRVDAAPRFVAPHQPRVDFQLWFYGLSFQRGTPRYVDEIARRLCAAPASVQPLFAAPLPAHPEAVRIVFWDYRFSPPGEANGAWWKRRRLGETRPLTCSDLRG